MPLYDCGAPDCLPCIAAFRTPNDNLRVVMKHEAMRALEHASVEAEAEERDAVNGELLRIGERFRRERAALMKQIEDNAGPADPIVALVQALSIILQNNGGSIGSTDRLRAQEAIETALRQAHASRKDAPHDWLIDHLQNVITDSIDVDWTPKDAATAVHDEIVGPLVEALHSLRKSAALLQQNAEGCAANHFAVDYAEQGLPGWLADTEAAIERARSALRAAGHPSYQE